MNARLRRAVIAGSLAVVFVCELATFRRWELKRRVVQLIALAPLSLDEVSLRGSLFASDSRYGAFLESVARAVPENAVVAVVAPKRSDFEWYTAHYALAPRRVVPPDRLRSADFVAVFDPGSVPHPGESWPVEFGSLRRLR